MAPVAMNFGAVSIFSSGIFLVLSWCAWSLLFWRDLRKNSVQEERIFDLMFTATIASLVGARAVFVILHGELFSGNLLKVVALWVQPGFSLLGGIATGVMVLLFLSRRFGVRAGMVLDALPFSLLIALVIGVMGSVLDGSMVGKSSELPWSVYYIGYTEKRHPVQLYYLVAYGVLAGILALVTHRARGERWAYGIVGVTFFLLWSITMFVLEFFSQSDVYWKLISANQWILVAIFAESVGAFYVRCGGRDMTRTAVLHVRASVREAWKKFYATIPKHHTG